MQRSMRFLGPLAAVTLFSAFLYAQTSLPRTPSLGAHPTASPRTGQPRQVPCWQQAGISKSTMDQRKQIQQDTRSQVEAVCADSSLTPQQKAAKIREIRQQAHQESEALITPEQQQAMKACQQERAANAPPHPAAPHPPHVAVGPCGETLPTPATPSKEPVPQSPAPQSEEQPQ